MDQTDLRRFAQLGLEQEIQRLNAALVALKQPSIDGNKRVYQRHTPGQLPATAQATAEPTVPAKARRTMSKAARKRISIATKARWAAKRAQAKP